MKVRMQPVVCLGRHECEFHSGTCFIPEAPKLSSLAPDFGVQNPLLV